MLLAKPYAWESLIYFPDLNFQIQKIKQPLKLVSTSLSVFLSQKQSQPQDQKVIQFGFLTQDQKQRILILSASDPLTEKLPLLGAWTYGISIFQDQVIFLFREQFGASWPNSSRIRAQASNSCTARKNSFSLALITGKTQNFMKLL